MRAQTISLIAPKRTDADVAEDVYMPDEKTNAVLRAEIDQLEKALGAAILEIKELNSKVDENHRLHNSQYHTLDRALVVLLGDGDLGDGLVRNHKDQLVRVWKAIKKGDENTWKLRLAVVAASLSTGGGVVYGLMRLLGG